MLATAHTSAQTSARTEAGRKAEHYAAHVRPTRLDMHAIKSSLRVEQVAVALVPGLVLKRQGRTLWGLSPFNAERSASFSIDPHKQIWHCFSTSQGGDAIALVQRLENLDFRGALDRLRSLGLIDPALLRGIDETKETPEQTRARQKRAEQYRQQQLEIARRDMQDVVAKMASAQAIWKNAVTADGTLAETYLRSRGIDTDALLRVYGFRVPPALRFVARLPYRKDGADSLWPAMVGAMALRPGQPLTAVHRTYLAADGSGKAPKAQVPKAKLMLGAAWGSISLLTPVMPQAIVGEGYETVLSMVSAAARCGRSLCALSAGSLGNLAGAGLPEVDRRGRLKPVQLGRGGKPLPSPIPDMSRPGMALPKGIAELTLLADNDGADPENGKRLVARSAARFRAQGVLVRVAWPPAGADFNDLITRTA